MTTITHTSLSRPAGRGAGGAGTLLGAAARSARKFVRALQYSRMISVLSQLSDDQLERAGIERAGIRALAHRLVYETE
jgi:uncharacterized protein YjiS (DUF1127 family)